MKKISCMIITLLASAPALAHHPLAGKPMGTFSQGFLSGVGHPLLGFDHLFFVALVGIAALICRRRFTAPLAYIGTMLVGCVISALWTSVPSTELMIALSLLLLGSMLLSGRRFQPLTILLAFASFGLFHGAAFGETLAAQEASFGMQVLGAYLLGLGVTQYAIALGTGLVFAALWSTTQASAIQARLAGALVAGAGLLLTLEHFEGALLQLLLS